MGIASNRVEWLEEKETQICLTIEELREVWEGAVNWLSGLEFGNHSLPNFEQFIESKGVNP